MPKQGLASIGIDIKINSVAMNYATDIGDIGGKPSELDVTCFKDKMKHNIPGVKDAQSWEVTYLYDNTDEQSDFRTLKALENAGNIVPVEVSFPDKTVFKTKGYVSTYVSGTKVDDLIQAKLSVSLQEDWTITDPTEATV